MECSVFERRTAKLSYHTKKDEMKLNKKSVTEIRHNKIIVNI